MAAQGTDETVVRFREPRATDDMAPVLFADDESEADWLIDYLSPEGRVRLWWHLLH